MNQFRYTYKFTNLDGTVVDMTCIIWDRPNKEGKWGYDLEWVRPGTCRMKAQVFRAALPPEVAELLPQGVDIPSRYR